MNKENEELKQTVVGDNWFAQEPSGKAYLIGNKCNVCKRVFFPRRGSCPVCVQENTLEDVELYDVSPVTYPAYPDTTIGARAFDVARLVVEKRTGKRRGRDPGSLRRQAQINELVANALEEDN